MAALPRRRQILTEYPELNEVLRDLVHSVRVSLGDSFSGAYLQGSFAVGDFDLHSDVDFVIAVRDELTDTQVAALQEIHKRIYDLPSEWAKHLEGSYFPVAILRDHNRSGLPLWYLDHGSQALVRSDHCNTVPVRWIVREKGVKLAGPNPATLVDPIPTEILRQHIAQAIADWGREILDAPDRYRNRFYQGFIVLNLSRMLHDLVVGHVGSKRAGANWAKSTFDPKWAPLIDRAWSGRPNPAVSVREPPDSADFASTLDFVAFIVDQSKRYAPRGQS
jgi:predicted nucleotidyltransferase